MIRAAMFFCAFLAIMALMLSSLRFCYDCEASGGVSVRGPVWWKCVLPNKTGVTP